MSVPQWKGLFDWSMKYQDGSRPTDWDSSDYNPDKMKWLEGVMKHYMQDFAARMKEIKSALDTGVGKPAELADAVTDTPAVEEAQVVLSLEDKEALLEELMDIVSSIDFARDLHKVGGLPTLLDILSCPHPSLQWRAAEVVATCVANNPPVQQWFLAGGVLPLLLALVNTPGQAEPQVMLRTKGLLALSGLTRHNRPGLDAAVQGGLVPRLGQLCEDEDVRVQRKAFSLLQYLLSQQPGLVPAAGGQQLVEAAQKVLTSQGHSCEGSDLRCAVLGMLHQLGQEPDGWDAMTSSPQLQSCLSSLQSGLATLSPEDQDSCQDEVSALQGVQALLAGGRPAAAPQVASDHLPADYDQHMSEPVTMNVAAEPAGQNGNGLALVAQPMSLM